MFARDRFLRYHVTVSPTLSLNLVTNKKIVTKLVTMIVTMLIATENEILGHLASAFFACFSRLYHSGNFGATFMPNSRIISKFAV